MGWQSASRGSGDALSAAIDDFSVNIESTYSSYKIEDKFSAIEQSIKHHNVYVIELGRWGIKNDGTSPVNTTVGINDALAWAHENNYTYVKLPAGTYLISKGINPYINTGQTMHDFSKTANILPPNNMTIDLHGCTLKKEVNGWEAYRIIRFLYSNNVTILGGTLEGDYLEHDYTSPDIHEGCNTVEVGEGSRNIVFDGVDMHSTSGYILSLTGGGRQLVTIPYQDWEIGWLSETDGTTVVNADYMRMNKFITLESLRSLAPVNAVPRGGTDHNGGVINIWGSGYGTFGTQYDGTPFNMSNSPMEIYFYDDANAYKGKIFKRSMDEINIRAFPAGATKFKISCRYDLNKVIPSTFQFALNSYNPSRGILVRNCKIHDGFSLAVAITGSQQIILENCELYNIGHTAKYGIRKLYFFPMGVDIEDNTNMNQNIIIRNCRFTELESLAISTVNTRNVLLDNNVFDNASVVFQGTRGTNLVSQNNIYHRCGGKGEGSPVFRDDHFIDGFIELSHKATYDNCKFNNFNFLIQALSYEPYRINTKYNYGNSVIPTGSLVSYYYVMATSVENTSWAIGTYNINRVVLRDGRIYKCTTKGATTSTNAPTHTSGLQTYADGYGWEFLGNDVEPTWNTSPSSALDTTDPYGNTWRRNAIPDYDQILFKNCVFSVDEPSTSLQFGMRRGSVEFDSCKFNLVTGPSGYFHYIASGDSIQKNSYSFRNCEINNINSIIGFVGLNKFIMLNTVINGMRDKISSNNTVRANQIKITGCHFNNMEFRISGIANNDIKTLEFTNNRIELNKSYRLFGASSEGISVMNIDNVFIEGNKAIASSVDSSGVPVICRPFSIYVEKFLKFTDNHIETNHATQNKLELFGAFRDSTYNLPVPKSVVHIDNNYVRNYSIQIDPRFVPHIMRYTGNGLTDISAATLNQGDYMLSSPANGVFMKGQIVYNLNPSSSGFLGWVCTVAGVANKVVWEPSKAYSLNSFINEGGKVYIATLAGVSGATAPSHIVGTATDGTVVWEYVGPLALFNTFGSIT